MLKKLAALTVLALGTVSVAHADQISGTISILGNDSFTSNTITFFNPAKVGSGTGVFAALPAGVVNGNPVTMFPGFSGALPYAQGQNTVPANISPVEVLTTSYNGITYSFFMTDYNAMLVSNVTGCTNATCLDVTGDGFFTVTGYQNTPGTFTFTTQETAGQTTTTFSASGVASPVPEPGTLAMVGSGLVGLAGFVRRKVLA